LDSPSFFFSGGLGDNFEEIINKFRDGVKLTIRGDPIVPAWGLCDAVVGRLAMADEELEANVAAVIGAVCAHRNPALGPFINRALLMVIPGDAHFALNITPFVPIPTEQQIEQIGKRMKKKKATAAATAEESQPSDSAEKTSDQNDELADSNV
uniref:Mediator of RNA polymerase II transcription subunit 25 n=1 Tax=Gongylonema pulchrum TaxID=637853 RepID=A0A183EUT2_9BILA